MTLEQHLAELRDVKSFDEYIAHRIAFTEDLIKERDREVRIEWRPFWEWLFYRKAKPRPLVCKLMFRVQTKEAVQQPAKK